MSQIDEILESLVTLPSLPTTVARILEMLDDPDVALSDVGEAIASDPSISMKTLRLVNSAYYGMRDEITSVEHAVSLLGMKVVRNVVLTASVFETLGCDEGRLMQHSVAVAVGMRLLVKHAGADAPFQNTEEAFMYGLLHDVGKIILHQHMPDEMARVRESVAHDGVSPYAAEVKILGFDHGQIGGELAERWKLQDPLTNAITYHHAPERCENETYRAKAAWVGLGDFVATSAGFPSYDAVPVQLPVEALNESHFDEPTLADIAKELSESRETIDELVSLAV